MKILYLSYACCPDMGSEYGVGWMVPHTLAESHPEYEVYVLTRSLHRDRIEQTLQLTPSTDKEQKGLFDSARQPNLHFLFYDIPSLLFYRKEFESHFGEQYNYLVWQILVRRMVRRVCRTQGIDIIHHLTFNQYRTPSPGFWMDVPFVMGPIGGAEQIAPAFWKVLEQQTRKKERIRRKGSDLRLFRWLCQRSENTKFILCSTKENQKRLQNFCRHCKVKTLPAIGIEDDFDAKTTEKPSNEFFTLVYAGKALDWKGLHLFLHSVQQMRGCVDLSHPIRVRLIGIRTEEEQKKVKRWIHDTHLNQIVELVPFMPREQLLQEMQKCSLSVYPAFRDSGSMSVLEACALGCPTICFDAGGQDAFPDKFLLKVRVGATYEDCIHSFASKLVWAYTHPEELKKKGRAARNFVLREMTWDAKVEGYIKIYHEALCTHKV